MKTTKASVAKDFAPHRTRLKRLEQRYTTRASNLHFDQLTHGDADLYPSILELAKRGLVTLRQHHRFFSKHALYDDGMFWYDLFVFISAAARRIQADRAQTYVPVAIVDRLIEILARMIRYSNVHPGDIAKRNDEALGNTLLAFYDAKRIRAVRLLGKSKGVDVGWVLRRVKQARNEAK